MVKISPRWLSGVSSAIPPRLRIVSFNDVYDLSNLARLQTFLKDIAQDHPPDVICLAGDFLSPSPLSALDNGKGAVATLRAIGITHLSLGKYVLASKASYEYENIY